MTSRGELEHILASAQNGDAVVLLDLDGFKAINDSRGHPAGDTILREFGQTVRAGLRTDDIALRYGGDEVLLLIRAGGAGGAHTFLERLRGEWRRDDRPTFSAGIAVQRDGQVTETLQAADRSLYAAKSRGGDQWGDVPADSGTSLKGVS